MVTDLFGKPIGGYPDFKLNLQQKRQATLLYYWMSEDYLKGLKALIDALIQGADVTLEIAKRQGRDELIANERWGVRDTSANWSTYALPALEDFRKSTVRLIAWRVNESYCGTGAYQCARMLSEYSSMWMTPEEEERFKEQFEAVYRYAQCIDLAAGAGGLRQLHDSSMADDWRNHAHLFPKLPRYRVRTDVEGVSGKKPPRTGVYVPQDDEYATLQFAWRGNDDGVLGEAKTLNDAGRRMMAAIGRDAMWLDGAKMAAYATAAFRSGEIKDRGGFPVGAESDPEFADGVLSANAFTFRPCKWYYVEKLEGEFDDEADATAPPSSDSSALAMRCEAHQPCPREGWWFTPAKPGSRRHFKQGEPMPEFKSDWGKTIWQWDERQSD